MKDGYKRLSILIISFMGALLVMVGIGKMFPGEGYSLFLAKSMQLFHAL